MTRSLPISCCAGAPSESSKGVPDDHGGGHGHCDGGGDQDCSGKWTKEEEKAEKEVGRKVMVVADGGSEEARTALQWALSHSVRPCDTVVLLDVAKPGKNGDGPKGYQQLEAMKSICQAKRPEVHVEVSLVEGKERGPAIVEAARRQGVSLLVMGQRRRSVTWRLLVMWMAGNRGASEGAPLSTACIMRRAWHWPFGRKAGEVEGTSSPPDAIEIFGSWLKVFKYIFGL